MHVHPHEYLFSSQSIFLKLGCIHTMNADFGKFLKCFSSKYHSLNEEDNLNVQLEHTKKIVKNLNAELVSKKGISSSKKTGKLDFNFHSLRCALGIKFRNPTKHLEQQRAVKELIQAIREPEIRYSNFPFGSKKYRSHSFHETHVHIVGLPERNKDLANCTVNPRPGHKLDISSRSALAKCLRREKQLQEKSHSESSLKKSGIIVPLFNGISKPNNCASHSYSHERNKLFKQLPQLDSFVLPYRPHSLERNNKKSFNCTKRSHSLEKNYKFSVTSDAFSICQVSSQNTESSNSPTLVYWNKDHTVTLAVQNGQQLWCINGEAVVTEMLHNQISDKQQRSGGNFINKPARGWLYPDHQIASEGISYSVKYIGCIEVTTSMKSLDFNTRSLVAKECINAVCEAAGIYPSQHWNKMDTKVQNMIEKNPNLKYSGSDVTLQITSSMLKLNLVNSQQTLHMHEMPNISFASGGDANMLDYVAYVAKSDPSDRACFVLECGRNLAQDVITTIGQAFELRFKEYFKKSAQNTHKETKSKISTSSLHVVDDPEYYNDLPGKIPPDITTTKNWVFEIPSKPKDFTKEQIELNDNLIDLNSEVLPMHDYVNNNILNSQTITDPFEVQPISFLHSKYSFVNSLQHEPWFHGAISRKEAELLLKTDGEFLVRESKGSPGQYVLTGMEGMQYRHLLLVNPVRTRDREFDSVSHLINYYCSTAIPIVSADGSLVLKIPVLRPVR